MNVFRQGGAALPLAEGEILGWGSEALVYGPAALPRLAAKVFHSPRPEHAARLDAMLAAPPAGEHFTWPLEPLRDGGGVVAGYLMPRVPADRVSIAELFQPRTRRTHAPAFTYRDLLRTGRALAAAIQALHDRGHVAGDLDDADILAGADARVIIRDTDSFQLRSPATGEIFRCATGRPELTPPELQGIRLADVDRAPEHDRFGLAVLLFQLLMEGTHPFACVSSARGDAPSIAERIRDGEFPYAAIPRGECRPAPHAPPLELLDPGIRHLFLRCFDAGHADPAARPAAGEWESALGRAERNMRGCGIHPQHVFGAHLDACPWCERAALLSGRDPFPPIDDTLPPQPAPARVRGPRTARVAPKVRGQRPVPAPVVQQAPASAVPPAPPAAQAPAPAAAPPAPAAASPTEPERGVNPFAGLALLLAVAGIVPQLRGVSWWLALASAVLALGPAVRRGGAGSAQLLGAAAVMALTFFAARTPVSRIDEWRGERRPGVAAVTPAPVDSPAAPVRDEPPSAIRTPEPEPEPTSPPARPKSAPSNKAAPAKSPPARSTPKATPKAVPTRSVPKAAPRPAPKATPRATPRPTPAPRTTPKAETRRAPRPVPKPLPRPPAPRMADEPRRAPSAPASELAPIRGELAIARTLKNQGAYSDAGATLRGVQQSTAQLSARYPGDRAVAELQQRARTLAAENRQACRAEASLLRSRGEPAPPCP